MKKNEHRDDQLVQKSQLFTTHNIYSHTIIRSIKIIMMASNMVNEIEIVEELSRSSLTDMFSRIKIHMNIKLGKHLLHHINFLCCKSGSQIVILPYCKHDNIYITEQGRKSYAICPNIDFFIRNPFFSYSATLKLWSYKVYHLLLTLYFSEVHDYSE